MQHECLSCSMLSSTVSQMSYLATRCLFNVSYKNLKSTVESNGLTFWKWNTFLYLKGRTNTTVGTSFFLHDSELNDYETYSQEQFPQSDQRSMMPS